MNESSEHPITNSDPRNRRTATRYQITGMVSFKWQSADGCFYEGIGIARDIGKGGVFIESDSIPPVGSPLTITVTLPGGSKPNVTLQLSGSGYVLHLQREPYPASGFGASAGFHVEVPKSSK